MVEVILRIYYKDHPVYETEEIRIKMSYTKLRQDVGFLWKENLFFPVDANSARFNKENYSLITDEFGFLNSTEAIIMRRNHDHINIIGIGDSFIHNSSFVLFDFFKKKMMFETY